MAHTAINKVDARVNFLHKKGSIKHHICVVYYAALQIASF